jgi:uncharacterized protein
MMQDQQPIAPIARCALPPSPELLRAVEQFNQRDYFECHETLEAMWNVERDLARAFTKAATAAGQRPGTDVYCDNLYKGILQVGVGCYHLLRDNHRGATTKLQSGADYLEPFQPRCMGVEVGQLIGDARRLYDAIVAAGPDRLRDVDRSLLPIIQLTTHDAA